jgi:hypothetical protein
MGKLPVVQRAEYIMYLEYANDLFWLHTDVWKWTSEVKKDYVRNLDRLQDLLNVPIYGLVDNEKLGKFGETIGFTFLQFVKGNDGNVYKVYSRSL